MGLRLVFGRAGAGKTEFCLKELRERLRQSPEGHSLILITPEHATFEIERELALGLEMGGFVRASVFGFRRLAHRILMETGGAVRPHITDLGKRLALSLLLKERQSELKILHKAAKQRTFADTLNGIIQEFKTYQITSADIAAVQAGISATPLGDKLHDLALLYNDFSMFLAGRYTDPEDVLSLFAQKIPSSALLAQAEIWIDGFTWFNPQELAVLEQLLKVSQQVTITLCLDDPQLAEHAKETSLFHRQWETYHKLLGLTHGQYSEVRLQDNARFTNLLLEKIERDFFRYATDLWTGSVDGLAIVEAANRRVEIEGMVREMLRLSRERGYRWRDMAVLLCGGDTYSELVETVLADYDIPFFSDRQRMAVHHPVAECIRSALEVVAGNWNYEAVFRCLKTDLLDIPRQDIDELENYVLEFGIRGTSRWTNNLSWNYVRRMSLGEDAEVSEAQQLALNRVDSIRRRAAAWLADLEGSIKKGATVRQYTETVCSFLLNIDVPSQLIAWGDQAEQANDPDQAREHRQIWGKVIEMFDQLVDTCGDHQMKLEEYAEIVSDGLEGLKLSLIPPGLDFVTVAMLDTTSIANVKAVFLPGVNDGALPKRAREEGLLNDGDRLRLAELGVKLAPGATADAFAERFMVYTALTRSREYLWVSYPLSDEEGKGLSPSLAVRRLREITQNKGLKTIPADMPVGGSREYIAHPKRSLSAMAAGLRECRSGQDISPLWRDVYNWALTADELQGDLRRSVAGLFYRNEVNPLPAGLAGRLYQRQGRLRGSVTRFESFRACPFKHFARYGLSLKERAMFRLKAPDLGQFLHAALKGFGDCLSAEGRQWGSLTENECAAICGRVVEQLAPQLQNEILLSSEQYKHLVKRLARTVQRSVKRLVEFDRVSQFKPMVLEKAFGRGEGALPPLRYSLPDGIMLEIAGQIDRLDVAEHNGRKYFLVVDYKSGGAWLKLVEVYHGLKLQLLTYLLVAQNAAEELIGAVDGEAAGVLYYFLKNPSVSSKVRLSPAEVEAAANEQLKMPGWVLADGEVVKLLDGSMDVKSEFLKVAFKKDGDFTSNAKAYIKTADEFVAVLRHVESALVTTAADILAGQVGIRPFRLGQQEACSYCEYRPVCQFDRLMPGNEYRVLTKLPEKEIMGLLTREGAAHELV